MGSQKKPDGAMQGGKPETASPEPPAPAKNDLGVETYPSARFIHGAFHPRSVPDEPVIAEPGG